MTKDLNEKPHYLGHRMRLKERFLKDEGKSMPDYELLEMLLALAIPRKDVKEKAKDLIKHFGSFSKVLNASYEKMVEYGLSTNVIAAFKLVKVAALKMSWQELKDSNAPVLSTFDYMLDYCKAAMSFLDVEEFRIVFLDAKLQVIKEETIQRGTITSVAVHPREVLIEALNCKSTAVILMHNHPSGKTQPSSDDIKVTKQIIDALKTVNIEVYDHIIISPTGYYSFVEHNILDKLKS